MGSKYFYFLILFHWVFCLVSLQNESIAQITLTMTITITMTLELKKESLGIKLQSKMFSKLLTDELWLCGCQSPYPALRRTCSGVCLEAVGTGSRNPCDHTQEKDGKNNAWMNGMHGNKSKPELREKLKSICSECLTKRKWKIANIYIVVKLSFFFPVFPKPRLHLYSLDLTFSMDIIPES